MKTILLWMDVETTGLDTSVDDLLEVAFQWTDDRLEPLDDGFSSVVRYEGSASDLEDVVLDMHSSNGLFAECTAPTAPDIWHVIVDAREYISARLGDDVYALPAGSSLRFDRNMLDRHMPGLLEGLSHRSLDVGVWYETIRLWRPDLVQWMPKKTTDHRARHCLTDEMNTALYVRSLLGETGDGE